MAASDYLENKIAKLIFNNDAAALIGDAAGLQPSAADGDLFIALFEDDPTDADVGTESTYTSYARIAVARTTGGVAWTITANVITNTALVTFPTSTGGSSTCTHIGIMTALVAGELLYHGPLGSSILVETDDIPKFAIGAISLTLS